MQNSVILFYRHSQRDKDSHLCITVTFSLTFNIHPDTPQSFQILHVQLSLENLGWTLS